MKTYIAQRLGIAVLTLFGMSIVIFVLLRLAPGDIVDVLFSAAGYVNPAEKKAILQELGMDKPVWQQYVDWITQIMRGDLGKSYRYDLPAWQIIRPLIPVTVELAILSTIVAVVLGVPTGVISAVRQDGALDYALRVFSLAGLSMPSFWLGMVIILTLVSWLAWIPPLTYVRPTENFWLHAVQFMLPALAVGYRSSALIMRITLFDDSRFTLLYSGDLDSCNNLLRHMRRLSRDALIDGIPYRQYWGEVLAAPSDRKQGPAPRYRILRPEDEAEVERLYQRLKTVGFLDQKNTTDEK